MKYWKRSRRVFWKDLIRMISVVPYPGVFRERFALLTDVEVNEERSHFERTVRIACSLGGDYLSEGQGFGDELHELAYGRPGQKELFRLVGALFSYYSMHSNVLQRMEADLMSLIRGVRIGMFEGQGELGFSAEEEAESAGI